MLERFDRGYVGSYYIRSVYTGMQESRFDRFLQILNENSTLIGSFETHSEIVHRRLRLGIF